MVPSGSSYFPRIIILQCFYSYFCLDEWRGQYITFRYFYCVKSVRIRSYSGPHFPVLSTPSKSETYEKSGKSEAVLLNYTKCFSRKQHCQNPFLVQLQDYWVQLYQKGLRYRCLSWTFCDSFLNAEYLPTNISEKQKPARTYFNPNSLLTRLTHFSPVAFHIDWFLYDMQIWAEIA